MGERKPHPVASERTVLSGSGLAGRAITEAEWLNPSLGRPAGGGAIVGPDGTSRPDAPCVDMPRDIDTPARRHVEAMRQAARDVRRPADRGGA